ncbi:cation channel sperm-associated protein 4 [Histomonas meleagridis]|uniref:cation channel sperm-associated protein 4 n=1 Tax=Histomonas meleagridis TaxID=135588 RepID=UPI00355955E9|nr:cation channel sperm-associated protein 4 [Histomonas meleagridis]KAH0796736.1 cation channel sperm-associated protein 4 [Histomonas meleagridis]
MFTAFLSTGSHLLVIILLILLFLLIISALAHVMFSDMSETHFGTISNSMFTIFVILTQAGWLESYGEVGGKYSTFVTIAFYVFVSFIGSFVLVNALTGVSSVSIEKAKKRNKLEQEENEIKEHGGKEKQKILSKLLAKKKFLEKSGKFRKEKVEKIRNAHKKTIENLNRLQTLSAQLNELTKNITNQSKYELNNN